MLDSPTIGCALFFVLLKHKMVFGKSTVCHVFFSLLPEISMSGLEKNSLIWPAQKAGKTCLGGMMGKWGTEINVITEDRRHQFKVQRSGESPECGN